MEGERFVPGHWKEPAHPGVIERYDDIAAIYRFIREKYQTAIDKAFDDVSRQIGFVVTTTVPIVLEIGNNGKVKNIDIAEHLKGTLFDKVTGVMEGQDTIPGKVKAGKYNLYLFWHDALKLKLRTDWMEPAHFRGLAGRVTPELSETITRSQEALSHVRPDVREPAHFVRPDVREPAHWFDPGIAIAGEEAILISAIDEVYPELKLMDRIASYRKAYRVGPGVREPAHFRQIGSILQEGKATDVLAELASVLRKYGY